MEYNGKVMPKAIHITKQELEQLYIQSNLTDIEIAKIYNCNHNTIYHKRKDFNISSNYIRSGNNNPNFRGYKEIGIKFYKNIKRNAIKRNYNFTISIEEIYKLYIQQQKVCILSKIPINFNNYSIGLGTASVDRINNNQHYTKNNIWLVHKDINIIKGTLSLTELYYYCQHITHPIGYEINHQLSLELSRHFNYKGYKWINSSLLRQTIINARKQNLIFDLKIEDLWILFENQKGLCAISKLPIFFAKRDAKEPYIRSASIDRIDSSKGYTLENVQWTHRIINRMKWDLIQSQFIEYCKIIYQNKNTALQYLKEYYDIDTKD